VLKVDALDVAYGEIRALKGVGLEVGQGEIVTILGNNGAGKTTTLKTISGLLHPTRGTITLENESILDVPPHAIVSRGIAHVPEGRRIFNRLTVRENLMMGAYLRSDPGIAPDLERVFGLFPRLAERLSQVGSAPGRVAPGGVWLRQAVPDPRWRSLTPGWRSAQPGVSRRAAHGGAMIRA